MIGENCESCAKWQELSDSEVTFECCPKCAAKNETPVIETSFVTIPNQMCDICKTNLVNQNMRTSTVIKSVCYDSDCENIARRQLIAGV
jgi:hypothetical protein